MEFRAWFRRILGAAALPQSENHVGQQQCAAFVLRHTIFRKLGFSQINVTTRRRSTSSMGASREPQTLSPELRAMGYRKLSARPRHHAQTEGAIEDFKKTSPSIFVAAPQGPITGFKMKRTGGASDQIVLDGLDARLPISPRWHKPRNGCCSERCSSSRSPVLQLDSKGRKPRPRFGRSEERIVGRSNSRGVGRQRRVLSCCRNRDRASVACSTES